jgi:hypothetical protein
LWPSQAHSVEGTDIDLPRRKAQEKNLFKSSIYQMLVPELPQLTKQQTGV